MNHTPAIDIWKGNNRVSRLWEDLLADRVSPDPLKGQNPVLQADQGPWAMEAGSPAARTGQAVSAEPSRLERAGFESLRLFRQTLEILTAPSEHEPDTDPASGSVPLWGEAIVPESMQWDVAESLGYVRVSREPEQQPGSAIDTRRMAYGLKIPTRPLHKRPIYQRFFFCLRSWIHPVSR